MKRLVAAVSASLMGLALVPLAPASAAQSHTAQAVLAGGCFWGMEAVFERLHGVRNVVAGFSGGAAATAHYEDVSNGDTGHAEAVEITYDPTQISYRTLLEVYFRVAHDPTELNYQGPDHGTQYRSEIFYTTEAQHKVADAEIAALKASQAYSNAIVTQVAPLHAFYAAEAYHQHYYNLHPDSPYIMEEDVPKVNELKARFPHLMVKP
jgi:peptide-methionine (S)-S-oxide reductase